MRSRTLVLWLVPALFWTSVAAAQSGVPGGACQGEPNAYEEGIRGEIVTPAYYFPAVPATAGRPALPIALTVWRVPCEQDGSAVLWVRMTTNREPGAARPRVTIVQDGVEKGWFGIHYGLPYASAPTSFTSSGQGFIWSRQIFDVGQVTGVQTAILHATVPFDPDRAFTLRLRYTQPEQTTGWTAATPDVVHEIPARGTPGNVASIPDKVAGLWWNPAEPGTALVLDRNERGATFAAWLTYNDRGDTTWFVMTNSAPSSGGGVEGTAYALRGQPFARFDYQAEFVAQEVGRFELRFTDANNGEFSYQVNGRAGRMPIKRLEIRTAAGELCAFSRKMNGVDNFMGWAVSLEGNAYMKGCGIHASLLTYDGDGSPMWVFSGLRRTNDNPSPQTRSPIAGEIYRPRGTPYGMPYDPARAMLGEPVGIWESSRQDGFGFPQNMYLEMFGANRALTARPFRFDY